MLTGSLAGTLNIDIGVPPVSALAGTLSYLALAICASCAVFCSTSWSIGLLGLKGILFSPG